jgi:hypothetical protein
MLTLEADHRRHAEIENAIRDLKYGMGLNHLPSGRFAANGAWLAVQVMAHNLARWTARIGLGAGIVTPDPALPGGLALGRRVHHRPRASPGDPAARLTVPPSRGRSGGPRQPVQRSAAAGPRRFAGSTRSSLGSVSASRRRDHGQRRVTRVRSGTRQVVGRLGSVDPG